MELAVAQACFAQAAFQLETGLGIGFYDAYVGLRDGEHDAVEVELGEAQRQYLLRDLGARAPAPVGFLPDEDEILARVVEPGNAGDARVAQQLVRIGGEDAPVEAPGILEGSGKPGVDLSLGGHGLERRHGILDDFGVGNPAIEVAYVFGLQRG